MGRRNDYDVRLMDYAASVIGKPFEWAQTNCAALVAAAVDAMADTSLFIDSICARCTSTARGLALSRRQETRKVLLAAGLVPVKSGFEQVGDIIVIFDGTWECSHIILGTNCLSSSLETGVALFSTAVVLKQCAEHNGEVFRCL